MGAMTLTIRSAQMKAFQADADFKLGCSFVARMRAAWPEHCQQLSDDQLLSLCTGAVSDARRLGLQTDLAVIRLLNLRFAVGHRFPADDGWAETILTNRQLSEAQRLDHVLARLMGGLDTNGTALQNA